LKKTYFCLWWFLDMESIQCTFKRHGKCLCM